ARSFSATELVGATRFDNSETQDVAQIMQQLAEFKRSTFVAIAIADLLGRLAVSETVQAMSQLADECIRAALMIAGVSLGDTARQVGDFCVIAMGKLGAEELNLSSDIDLMYIYGGPDDAHHQDAARRLGEAVTEVLGGGCFRVDMR